jgi:hypothetical protein
MPPARSVPASHSVKFFASSKLLEQVKDRTWLAKVTNALNQHWQKRNAAKKNSLADNLPNKHSYPVSVSMATGG